MEEDIKILENLKEYLQMLIDNGIHKIQYNELWHDEKTVDCINALENLIKRYRELEEFVEAIKELQKTKTPIVELVHEMNKFEDEFISKSKIKEKIEKYKKLGNEFYEKFLKTNKTCIDIHDAGLSCDAKVQVLQELMDK